MNSPYTDGFSGFEYKKDLYRIKAYLDNALDKAPTFADEDKWLEEFNTEQAFDKLGAE